MRGSRAVLWIVGFAGQALAPVAHSARERRLRSAWFHCVCATFPRATAVTIACADHSRYNARFDAAGVGSRTTRCRKVICGNQKCSNQKCSNQKCSNQEPGAQKRGGQRCCQECRSEDRRGEEPCEKGQGRKRADR